MCAGQDEMQNQKDAIVRVSENLLKLPIEEFQKRVEEHNHGDIAELVYHSKIKTDEEIDKIIRILQRLDPCLSCSALLADCNDGCASKLDLKYVENWLKNLKVKEIIL